MLHERTIAYFVEADDLLLAPWFIVTGGYETEPTNSFRRELRRDSPCLDVGANFGYYTCLTARFAPERRVFAVEADHHVWELAREAIHAAAGDANGKITLFRRRSRLGNTSIQPAARDFTDMLGERPAEQFDEPCVRIDALAEWLGGRVDFIKIDVEGAEPLALAGAARTIAGNPGLAIVMEWSPGQIVGAGFDLGEFLRSLDAQSLRAFTLTKTRAEPIFYAALANMPYSSGIVLRR